MDVNYTASRLSFEHQARARTATVVAPATVSPEALLLFFHGSLQSSNVARNFTGHTFDDLTARGVVVAYPDGVHHHFNDARRDLDERTRQLRIDDVGFTRLIVDKLCAQYSISPARVFGCGFSNGGQMVLRLLHDAPGLFAGAATYAATLPAEENLLAGMTDTSPAPAPFLSIHGTADPISPHLGGEVGLDGKKRGKVRSLHATGEYFARINGHAADAFTRHTDGTVVTCDWAGEHPPVRVITVEGMGHLVPSPKKMNRRLGEGTEALIAADITAAFFNL